MTTACANSATASPSHFRWHSFYLLLLRLAHFCALLWVESQQLREEPLVYNQDDSARSSSDKGFISHVGG